jgi:hypothetical protein
MTWQHVPRERTIAHYGQLSMPKLFNANAEQLKPKFQRVSPGQLPQMD